MKRIETSRSIRAPREEVFELTARIEDFPEVVPEIERIEFLTDRRVGAGTRFRQTRVGEGRPIVSHLEVTEFQPPSRIRFVSVSAGSSWDTTFTFLNSREGTEVHLLTSVQPRNNLVRLINHFTLTRVLRSLETDLDAIKTHFEPEFIPDAGGELVGVILDLDEADEAPSHGQTVSVDCDDRVT